MKTYRPRSVPDRLVLALDRLLRTDQHETLRVLDGQQLLVADFFAFPCAVDDVSRPR